MKWPFGKSVESAPRTPPETIESRVDRLESQHRQLQTEWLDTYERVMRALRRLNKRAQDAAAREEEEAPTSQVPLGAPISGQPILDPISAAIMARRARALPTGPNGGGG